MTYDHMHSVEAACAFRLPLPFCTSVTVILIINSYRHIYDSILAPEIQN